MIILFFVTFILLVVIFIFASPKLSPIPYFPSNHHDLPLIVKALNLQNNQTIIDLGAGDGIVIFKAAQQALNKNLNTNFIAIDINPILILILHIRRLFHPNRKNIKIVFDDFFKMNLNSLTHGPINSATTSNVAEAMKQFSNLTIYLYISPWLLEKTLSIIKKTPGKKNIVSYFYPIKSLKPKTHVNGVHNLYTYSV